MWLCAARVGIQDRGMRLKVAFSRVGYGAWKKSGFTFGFNTDYLQAANNNGKYMFVPKVDGCLVEIWSWYTNRILSPLAVGGQSLSLAVLVCWQESVHGWMVWKRNRFSGHGSKSIILNICRTSKLSKQFKHFMNSNTKTDLSKRLEQRFRSKLLIWKERTKNSGKPQRKGWVRASMLCRDTFLR